jgi:hypothetical protein
MPSWVSWSHLEETDFNTWTALATEMVRGKESSKWIWSAVPPMANAGIPFSRAIPPM